MDALSTPLLLNLLENLQSAVLIQAEDGNIRYANKLFYEMFHHTELETISGKSTLERAELISFLFIEPEKFVTRVRELLEKKEPVKNELLYLTDGRVVERDFIPAASLEKYYDGNLWLFRDITDRKKLEKELLKTKNELENKVLERTKKYEESNAYLKEEIHFRKQSEEKLLNLTLQLKKAQQIANLGSWEWDLKNNKFEFSEQITHITGYSPNEIEINPDFLFKLIKPEYHHFILNRLENPDSTTENVRYEFEITCKNGETKTLYSVSEVITDQYGNPVRRIGIVHDITVRKKAEEALRRSEQKFRDMADNVPVMIWVTDQEGQATYLNKQWCDYTGQTGNESLASGWLEALHPDDRYEAGKLFISVIQKKEPYNFIYRLRKKDGSYRWMLDTGLPKFDSEGNFEGYIGSVIDIHERKLTEEALKESERQLAEAQQIASLGSWEWNVKSNKITWSDELYRIYGMKPQEKEINYDSFLYFLHPDDSELLRQAHRHVLKTRESVNIDHRIILPDGEIKYINGKGEAIVDDNGKLVRLIGTGQDITERKLAEKKLRYRVALEKLITELSTEFIRLPEEKVEEGINYALKRIGEFTNVDRSYIFLFSEDFTSVGESNQWLAPGIESHQEQLSNVPVKDIPWWMEKLKDTPYLYFPNVGELPPEARLEKLNLGCKNVQSLIIVPLNSGDKTIGFIGFDSIKNEKIWDEDDINLLKLVADLLVYTFEMKKARLQIREQADLLNISQDAIIVKDFENRILFWNKGSVSIYGWQPNEVLGKNVDDIVYKDKSIVEHTNNEILRNKSWHGELKHVNKFGQELTVESRRNLVTDENGQPKSILIVNTDITEKKKLEEQFLRAQRMESIGTLASGIAHDLNNILSPILISVSLLRQELPPEKKNRFLDIMESNINRGTEIIKQVLSFARGVKGEYISIDPTGLINEIVKTLKETFPKSIQIKTSVSHDICLILGDKTHLYQVMMNLCVNARDAMPEGGRLVIKAENILIDQNNSYIDINAKPGAYVRISVADTGTGIAENLVDKIFEPFFTTKGYGKGTGLGLSTAIGIINSHKGFMTVRSEPGKGTEFSVYLPLSDSDEIKSIASLETDFYPAEDTVLLVVDDEPLLVEIARMILEGKGYKILTANDGAEAVSIYAKNKDEIKVVLIDVMMPYMDGNEAIKVLENLNPEVKIIASSGIHKNKELKNKFSSVKTFLEKPYTADSLLRTVAELVNE